MNHMPTKIITRLRGERLRWGFTQRELAPLLLIKHATQLSRVERGKRPPSIESVLASCVVFGRDIEYIFPGYQSSVEDRVIKMAYRLYTRIEKSTGDRAQKKRDLLERVAQLHKIPCK